MVKDWFRIGFGVDFGVTLRAILETDVILCWKNECKKTDRKKGTPKCKRVIVDVTQGSRTAPPRVKELLSNWTRNNNNSTQTLTTAQLLLQSIVFVWFLVIFQFQVDYLTRPGQGPANSFGGSFQSNGIVMWCPNGCGFNMPQTRNRKLDFHGSNIFMCLQISYPIGYQ